MLKSAFVSFFSILVVIKFLSYLCEILDIYSLYFSIFYASFKFFFILFKELLFKKTGTEVTHVLMFNLSLDKVTTNAQEV